MRLLFIIFIMSLGLTLLGQDKIFLKSGEVIKGKIVEKSDSTIVINTRRKINNEYLYMDMMFYRSKIERVKDISQYKKASLVTVELVGGRILQGNILSKNDQGIVLTNIKGTEFDTLMLKNRQIKQIKNNALANTKSTFVDIGFLRGGALIGAELELVIAPNITLFAGGGYRGYAGGINIYFKEGLRGFGFKSGYFNQGFGDYYAGSYYSNGFTYKSYQGLTMDLGLGFITGRGNYNYEGRNLILTYGIGLRF